ncbi:hypothetical protein ACFLU8_05745 [Chloroflexota bacterium]
MDFEDLGDIGKILTYLVPAIIIILTNVVFRKQKQQREKLTVVRSLISEIGTNQKLMESFSLQWHTKKFKIATWKKNKDKMDYIDPALHYTLADTFEIAEEFNREIDAAKKHKSMGYLAGIRVDRLGEPLAKSKQGLEEWLTLNQSKNKLPMGT